MIYQVTSWHDIKIKSFLLNINAEQIRFSQMMFLSNKAPKNLTVIVLSIFILAIFKSGSFKVIVLSVSELGSNGDQNTEASVF